MKRDVEQFLEEGLSKYPEAKAVISAFESQLSERLRSMLGSRRAWKPLKQYKVSTARPGGDEKHGWWIPAYISGTTLAGDDVGIDLGLWWGAQDATHNAIIYASFYEKPQELLTFTFNGTRAITTFLHHGRTVLQSPIPEHLDFENTLNAEVDILLAQLITLSPGNRSRRK